MKDIWTVILTDNYQDVEQDFDNTSTASFEDFDTAVEYCLLELEESYALVDEDAFDETVRRRARKALENDAMYTDEVIGTTFGIFEAKLTPKGARASL